MCRRYRLAQREAGPIENLDVHPGLVVGIVLAAVLLALELQLEKAKGLPETDLPLAPGEHRQQCSQVEVVRAERVGHTEQSTLAREDFPVEITVRDPEPVLGVVAGGQLGAGFSEAAALLTKRLCCP